MNPRCLLAVVLLSLVLAAPSLAAEQVKVRGGVHADFGRLVFDWGAPVGYAAEIADGRLTVRFDRPAAFDTASAERHLFRYLEEVSVAPDGRSLSFELEGSYGLTGFTLGPKVVLDLANGGAGGQVSGGPTPPASTAQAASEPAQAERTAESAPSQPASTASPPEVRVRVGQHTDFERLVFDWPSVVGYRSTQSGESAELVFEESARLDVSRLQARPPSLLRRFADRRVEGETRVALQVAPGTRLRVFADGPRVVVDLMRPNEQGPAPEADAPPAPALAATDESVSTSAPAAPQDAPTPLLPTSTEPTPAAEPAAAAAATAQSERPDATPQPQAPPSAASAPLPEPAAPPVPAAEVAATPVPESPGFVSREAVEAPEARPMPGTAAPATPPVLLRFAWPDDTGAVALKRGAGVLLGFADRAPVDLAAALAELAPELGPVAAVETDGGTLLHFEDSPFYMPQLWSDGAGWLVEFRRAGGDRPGGAPIQVRRDGAQAQVHLAVDRPRVRMQASDPASGDPLVLVPLAAEGQATPEGREFAAFELLPTMQGLAIRPRIEDLEVALADDGVRIAAPGPSVTPGRQPGPAEVADLPGAMPPRLFDLAAWRLGGADTFNDRRQKLQRAVIDARGPSLGLARLALARFYFAHGLGSEALGVLSLIRRENAELRADPQLLLLEAASRLLVGDHQRAQELLGEPALLNEPEADLWRAALAGEAQDWPAAAELFREAESLLEDYPRPVRLRLRLAAAEATLEAGDPGAAATQLERAGADLVTDLERARHDFLFAMLLDAEGERDEARETFKRLAAGGLGAPSVQARLALIDAALAAGEMPADEAIEQLEQLRFAWRGDAFEFALLQRLGELYQREGRWREALRALRQAATYFPGTSRAEAAAKELSALFARLFLGPDRPEIPPLTSLSLYEEFRELTPPGAPGNRLIEQLADRLVAVDLLDRAAGLLEGQVQFRLSGEEKTRVGARLALIRLLDRKPREALKALEISATSAVPEELQRQRRHLRARALSDLGRSAEALALLEGDSSLDALRLRAEVLWAERDWASAAVALAATLPPAGEATETLPVETSGQVLNLAVAYTLAGERQELQSLRQAWAPAMAEGPHAEAFALLAEDLDPQSVATIAQQLAQVDRVQAFMSSYRARLRETQLSDLN